VPLYITSFHTIVSQLFNFRLHYYFCSFLYLQNGRTVLLIFSIHGSGSFQGIARVTEILTGKPAKDYIAPGLAANFAIEWLKKFVQVIF